MTNFDGLEAENFSQEVIHRLRVRIVVVLREQPAVLGCHHAEEIQAFASCLRFHLEVPSPGFPGPSK